MALYILLCLIQILLISAYENKYFFLSQNQFTWEEAKIYCRDHCKSDLASIHTNIQNILSINILNNTHTLSGNNSDNDHIWIGLSHNANLTSLFWSDNTIFDFGKNITKHPWDETTTLTSDQQQCIHISPSHEYLWQISNCSTSARALCNSCDGELNKFIQIQIKHTWQDASGLCNSHYGTNLASIHSFKDYSEAELISMSGDTWIGLNYMERDENSFVWSDGTAWDFANDISGVSPWNSGEPNNKSEECVEINVKDSNAVEQIYGLNDELCSDYNYALCNMPSALCYGSDWHTIIDDGDISWNGLNDIIHCDLSIDGDVMMLMKGKQWVNHNGLLRVNYMYSIEAKDDTYNGDSGLLIDFVDNCDFWYVGIEKQDEQYSLFIGKAENGEYNQVENKEIYFYTEGAYYELSVDVINGSLFNASVNGQYLIYNHEETVDYNYDGIFSGYIGIKNRGLFIRAKSLFVSGSAVYEWPNMNSTISKTTNSTSTECFYSSSDSPTQFPTPIPKTTGTNITKTTREYLQCLRIILDVVFEDLYNTSLMEHVNTINNITKHVLIQNIDDSMHKYNASQKFIENSLILRVNIDICASDINFTYSVWESDFNTYKVDIAENITHSTSIFLDEDDIILTLQDTYTIQPPESMKTPIQIDLPDAGIDGTTTTSSPIEYNHINPSNNSSSPLFTIIICISCTIIGLFVITSIWGLICYKKRKKKSKNGDLQMVTDSSFTLSKSGKHLVPVSPPNIMVTNPSFDSVEIPISNERKDGHERQKSSKYELRVCDVVTDTNVLSSDDGLTSPEPQPEVSPNSEAVYQLYQQQMAKMNAARGYMTDPGVIGKKKRIKMKKTGVEGQKSMTFTVSHISNISKLKERGYDSDQLYEQGEDESMRMTGGTTHHHPPKKLSIEYSSTVSKTNLSSMKKIKSDYKSDYDSDQLYEPMEDVKSTTTKKARMDSIEEEEMVNLNFDSDGAGDEITGYI